MFEKRIAMAAVIALMVAAPGVAHAQSISEGDLDSFCASQSDGKFEIGAEFSDGSEARGSVECSGGSAVPGSVELEFEAPDDDEVDDDTDLRHDGRHGDRDAADREGNHGFHFGWDGGNGNHFGRDKDDDRHNGHDGNHGNHSGHGGHDDGDDHSDDKGGDRDSGSRGHGNRD